jgi:hypothetical protein
VFLEQQRVIDKAFNNCSAKKGKKLTKGHIEKLQSVLYSELMSYSTHRLK